MRQVVIEAKVGSLRIHWRQAVAGDGVAAEGLLDTEHRFETADHAVSTAECLHPIIGLDPVALGMMAAGKLGAQAESCVPGLPPGMGAIEVLMRPLQKTIVGEPQFQALLGQVKVGASSSATMSAELLIGAAGRIEIAVVDRILVALDGIAAQHPAQAAAARQNAKRQYQRNILEIADPDWSKSIVVGVEWNEIVAGYDGKVMGRNVIALQVSEANEVRVVVARQVAAIWRKTLEQSSTRLDKDVLAEGSGKQRLGNGEVRGAAGIGAGEEADAPRDERCVLRRAEMENRQGGQRE